MPRAVTSKSAGTSKAVATAAPKKPIAKRKANGYQMPERIPLGEVLTDLSKQQWRIGPSIGSGGFGEIYCACKANEAPKKHDDYPFVVKVEPHGNGPLFVEMHFYMRNGKLADIQAFQKKRNLKSIGMPHFVGHGSHELNKVKHRFIVMPRFGADIYSLFLENNRKLPLHTVYRLAIQMLDVYEYIHECTYIHADLKAANMLLGFGKNGGSQAYLVDFGLASHYTTKDFKPDPKKMHNGTIEYTSRDAHQGVPTMRGDFEILAYNLIHWAGGDLPWETNKLLGSPPKVQQAKEDFMKSVESSVKQCFAVGSCPDPILNYFKYVAKLNFDSKPDYEKCRKEFLAGLKSLGKTNTGDLEFKSTVSKKAAVAPKETRKVGRTNKAVEQAKSPGKADENNENVSPKLKSRKRNPIVFVEENSSPSKKSRAAESKKSPSRSKNTQVTTVSSSTESPIVINKYVNGTKSVKSKTCYVNLELDISLDAKVVVSVKRKPRNKRDKSESPDSEDKNTSVQSTDEIAPTEQSYVTNRPKMTKRVARTSPRSNK